MILKILCRVRLTANLPSRLANGRLPQIIKMRIVLMPIRIMKNPLDAGKGLESLAFTTKIGVARICH
jgi:hypothetical protein